MSLLIRHSRSTSALCHRQLHVGLCVFVAKLAVSESMNHCYSVLNVSAACSSDELRHAYLSLVKKYHPDSVSGSANADKFAQVEDAYRRILVSIEIRMFACTVLAVVSLVYW